MCPWWRAATFCWVMCFVACTYSLHQNHMGQLLRAPWDAVSQATVLSKTLNKHNSQLLLRVCFFFKLGFFLKKKLCWVFIAVRRLSLVAASVGYSLVVAPTPVVVEHGLYGIWASVAVAHGFSCLAAYGIFTADQESNRCPLHYKADS